ncbi:MAG: YdcF family protein [Synergistes jonesii]|uniref:YdcF family protein n=1 Tax=Synergistes jonesii TaxID=2754 RepID=UPI002A751EBA|nr:YdcF family protein [Synergistes jonesii]MDY2985490.1 YdcF family protein [Synergistes jonesii]
MFFIYKLAGSLAVPPGLFILLLLFSAFAASRRPRGKSLSALLAALAALFYLMSAPAGSALITGTLEGMTESALPPDKAEAALLVPAGGSSYDGEGSSIAPSPLTLERLYAAVRLAASRGGKTVMIMSGGNAFGDRDRSEARTLAQAAREMGWRGTIMLEERSRTTAENMRYAAELVRRLGIKRLIVVTNAYHLPRATMIAKEALPDVGLYPYAPWRITDPLIRGYQSLLPDGGSFALSCAGLREYAGIAAHKLASLCRRIFPLT